MLCLIFSWNNTVNFYILYFRKVTTHSKFCSQTLFRNPFHFQFLGDATKTKDKFGNYLQLLLFTTTILYYYFTELTTEKTSDIFTIILFLFISKLRYWSNKLSFSNGNVNVESCSELACHDVFTSLCLHCSATSKMKKREHCRKTNKRAKTGILPKRYISRTELRWGYTVKYFFQNILWIRISGRFQVVSFCKLYNQFYNILRLFDALPNFPFTSSETMCNYYL